MADAADIAHILQDAVARSEFDGIALSGGLDSTILAHLASFKKPRALAVAVSDFASPDLDYSWLAAEFFGLELEVIEPSISEIAGTAEKVVGILGNFNDIEIRNATVMYVLLSKAKESGLRRIMTGDGADELFAGYRFFERMEPELLQKDLERVWKIMHFTSQKIAASLGIAVVSPFLDDKVVKAAKAVNAKDKVGQRGGRRYGKMVLREAFEAEIPDAIAWREKAAMQDGSGTAGMGAYFDGAMDDGEFASERERIHRDDGVSLRSKESLHYYAAYRKNHGPPAGGGCPQCGGDAVSMSKFCRMCGAYPI